MSEELSEVTEVGPAATEEAVQVRRVGPGGSMASDNAFAVALLTLWHRVSEAGGAVGFVPPVDRSDVGPAVAVVIDGLRSGRASAFALTSKRNVIGFAMITPGVRTQAHIGAITSVMVDPAHQGKGLGVSLMEAIVGLAAELGLEQVSIGARGGVGLEKFYAAMGFVEVGRLPGWIRVGPGDDRDEILMVKQVGARVR
ncbi:GNAT superfamily N-acetyltransferase [Nakamurella sp. UYEF19]|uniref:GNAT family N-acetyltransferase n=1 Tax=Nakamurella sp. UYEF19 TaxID=1756392 RepID=UPI003399DD7E